MDLIAEAVVMENNLVNLCIEAATESATAVDKWRRQRQTLELMPFQLGEALLHRLVRGRIMFPSLLEYVFKRAKVFFFFYIFLGNDVGWQCQCNLIYMRCFAVCEVPLVRINAS